MCRASGIDGMPASCRVLALFLGEDMGEGVLSIRVKERETCSVRGLLSVPIAGC